MVDFNTVIQVPDSAHKIPIRICFANLKLHRLLKAAGFSLLRDFHGISLRSLFNIWGFSWFDYCQLGQVIPNLPSLSTREFDKVRDSNPRVKALRKVLSETPVSLIEIKHKLYNCSTLEPPNNRLLECDLNADPKIIRFDKNRWGLLRHADLSRTEQCQIVDRAIQTLNSLSHPLTTAELLSHLGYTKRKITPDLLARIMRGDSRVVDLRLESHGSFDLAARTQSYIDSELNSLFVNQSELYTVQKRSSCVSWSCLDHFVRDLESCPVVFSSAQFFWLGIHLRAFSRLKTFINQKKFYDRTFVGPISIAINNLRTLYVRAITACQEDSVSPSILKDMVHEMLLARKSISSVQDLKFAAVWLELRTQQTSTNSKSAERIGKFLELLSIFPKCCIKEFLTLQPEDFFEMSCQEIRSIQAISGLDLVRMAQARSMRARNVLVAGCYRLPFLLVRSYEHLGLEVEDLIQEGFLGLIEAANKFDYMIQPQFSVYAQSWIRQRMARSIADLSRTIRVPAHLVEAINKIRKNHVQSLEGNSYLSRPECSVDRNLIESVPVVISLNTILPADSVQFDEKVEYQSNHLRNFSLGDSLIAGKKSNPNLLIAKRELREAVDTLLHNLTRREEEVLRFRFGFDVEHYTLERIGKHFGVTRERVRQIEQDALQKLQWRTSGGLLKERLIQCCDFFSHPEDQDKVCLLKKRFEILVENEYTLPAEWKQSIDRRKKVQWSDYLKLQVQLRKGLRGRIWPLLTLPSKRFISERTLLLPIGSIAFWVKNVLHDDIMRIRQSYRLMDLVKLLKCRRQVRELYFIFDCLPKIQDGVRAIHITNRDLVSWQKGQWRDPSLHWIVPDQLSAIADRNRLHHLISDYSPTLADTILSLGHLDNWLSYLSVEAIDVIRSCSFADIALVEKLIYRFLVEVRKDRSVVASRILAFHQLDSFPVTVLYMYKPGHRTRTLLTRLYKAGCRHIASLILLKRPVSDCIKSITRRDWILARAHLSRLGEN